MWSQVGSESGHTGMEWSSSTLHTQKDIHTRVHGDDPFACIRAQQCEVKRQRAPGLHVDLDTHMM